MMCPPWLRRYASGGPAADGGAIASIDIMRTRDVNVMLGASGSADRSSRPGDCACGSRSGAQLAIEPVAANPHAAVAAAHARCHQPWWRNDSGKRIAERIDMVAPRSSVAVGRATMGAQ